MSLGKGHVIKLTPRKIPENAHEKDLELICPDQETHDTWLARFKRVCMNEATHGIEIQTIKVDNSGVHDYFKDTPMGKGKLELSVWDFAGQHDYYNHHYFLSTRTVFMFLWKMSEGDKGLKNLEFWFRYLAAHLTTLSAAKGSEPRGNYFSVIVVGTFLDYPSIVKGDKALRAQKVDLLATNCGLLKAVQYYEVSCSASFENIEFVLEAITKTALGHSYMGERVPRRYLLIGNEIVRIRDSKKANQEAPLMDMHELTGRFGDGDYGKCALGLLSLWGECVYFDSPDELASIVILDPLPDQGHPGRPL